ncbi:MAG: formate dehydrogenase subunit gamma [Rhodocyclaceae bacterium]|nr:formate dehydrogenase subunit gamma [Rhodocyclaceae bacterium]
MQPLCGESAILCARPIALRAILFLIFSIFLLAAVRPAWAADPPAAPGETAAAPAHNAAPYWREVRKGEVGVTTVKGAETAVLVQSEGNIWRHLRNGPVTYWGGLLLIAVFAAIAVFHGWKGTLRLSSPPVGRKLQRFSTAERLIHGLVAGSFVLLALGGLLMLFGKHVVMPVLGHTVLSVLLQVLKPVHNFLGLVFVFGLLLMILMWLKDNVWDPIDAQWIRRAGGLLDRSHVPSGRFNFGEKTWFWFGVTILGLTVSGSGLLLDFPTILQLRSDLQMANLVHGVGALLMMLLALGHIYMGTIGVEGAFDSMRTGKVDETWAKEHHEAWYDQLTAKGK